jgi:hypothetical protein
MCGLMTMGKSSSDSGPMRLRIAKKYIWFPHIRTACLTVKRTHKRK